MSDYKIQVTKRNEKINKVRADGLIPAVVYGKDFETIAIAMNKVEFAKLFKHAGTSNLIELALDGKKYKTLIHEMQVNPVNSDMLHVDFFKVNMKEKIHAEIPLVFTGDSNAVIHLEGSLITPVDTIEIECLPADLPSEINVDISVLDDFDKDIRLQNLVLPDGVELIGDLEEVVAFVQEPRSEEEIESLDEEVVENVDAIEVENKGEETPAEDAAEKKED